MLINIDENLWAKLAKSRRVHQGDWGAKKGVISLIMLVLI